ncbi:MAG: transglycosylase SLT domain-containing protein [Stellaceae bacterium]
MKCGPAVRAVALAGLCLAAAGPAAARHAAKPPRRVVAVVAAYLAAHPQSAETVRFGHAGWAPVKIVRGGGWTAPAAAPQPTKAATAETVTFADPNAKPVRVLRGEGVVKAPAEGDANGPRTEKISFADPREMPVTVIRGPALAADFGSGYRAGFGLYAPADAADLDRVAFAVDGAESSHGADPGMWRADPAGPQGPMQVSRAAALDVGGGDRFDIAENRVLGRAYLARLFRRYGNWADAVMAYNWGPAHLDAWIAGGRPVDQVPIEVERYRDRVLSSAGLAPAGANWPLLDPQHLASLAPR